MTILLWTAVILILLYTIGFSITLWKEKNKLGSIVVIFLALLIVIAPFFISVD